MEKERNYMQVHIKQNNHPNNARSVQKQKQAITIIKEKGADISKKIQNKPNQIHQTKEKQKAEPGRFPTISEEGKQQLIREVTIDEIKLTVFNTGSWSAPGSDGLPAKLKHHLSSLIANTQASFVTGRVSADNILIAQEVVHTMRTRNGGTRIMAIKMDLEKAYDRLNWLFIIDTLRYIGIPEEIITLINLYDIVLFAQANRDQVDVVKEALKIFCESSGQKVSLNKSCVFFSKNVNHNIREELSQELGIPLTSNLGKYLGVPLIHEKCRRATLVQSVLSSIPSYVMQTMKVLIKICNKIDKICRDFLWGSSDQDRKIHPLSWDTVCKPKDQGGLDIRKAQETNNIFLMKPAWGLMTKSDSLWVKVFKAKYSCGENLIPKVHQKANCSNAWKGIVKV
ncbi:uncharacterized protein LOC107475603 [Arachis duranensis]|uniref:Uncharacterized protein LOC107475603 n=1 Tax=Arachis duranensis TaxID=130453 RepID=A0A6P4CGV9_ARADU|nr:uncharacterized protein LOC107475603 [Arachis duranensis]